MFTHYIINQDNNALIKKVFLAQIANPAKNDLIHTIRENLEELEIYLDFENLEELSKDQFKNFVHKKIETRVLEYLNRIKSTHS